MEEETTRFCGNCRKDVVSSNFSLHEVHCKRFLRLCPDCGESVPDKDMKEHQNENHRKVRCDLCHRIVQQYLLEEHKSTECDERPVICQFCELQMPHCKLQEHVDGCGSRTELCPDCKKYIMHKNLDQHKDNCPAVAVQPDTTTRRKDIKKKLRCPKCSTLLTESTFLRHQNECNPLSQFQGASSKKPGSNANTFRPISPVLQPWSEFRSSLLDEPEIQIQDKVDNVKFQEYSFRSRYSPPFLKERSAFMEGALAGSFSMNKQTSQLSPEDELAYDVLKACTRCNVLLPSPTLKQHEKKCIYRGSLPSPY